MTSLPITAVHVAKVVPEADVAATVAEVVAEVVVAQVVV
jgi:hypothetical protein